ncbi:MAG: hypothetical protein JNJ80_09250 [Gemmatimonadetes bacterium]|nr:hypothetical protein [Gemmatimonadota bacterium]
MAVRSTTGAIAVTDLATGQPLSRLAPETDTADDSGLRSVADEYLVEACSSGTLRVRRAGDLQVEYLEQHPADMLGPVAASAAGDRWVIAFNRRQLGAPDRPRCRIEVRSWPLGRGVRTQLGDQFGKIAALALAPDGERIAILEEQRRSGAAPVFDISLITVATGSVDCVSTHAAWRSHRGFAWSPSGDLLVVGTESGHALLDGRTLAPAGHLPGEYSSDAAFSPDGRLLALGYWGHGVVLPVTDLASWFGNDPASSEIRAV